MEFERAPPPGRIHRIPETPDQERGARNLFDRRSWLGSSGEESRRFRVNAGREIALVLSAVLWANPQSLLSLSGQIFRFIYGGHVASDAFIVILGVLLMGFIAWAAEWRERMRAALANKPPSS
jgi:hypothetical protein